MMPVEMSRIEAQSFLANTCDDCGYGQFLQYCPICGIVLRCNSHFKTHFPLPLYNNHHLQNKDLFLSISKVNRIEVNCAFMLHRSMRITAFLVVYIAMSILEQTNL